MHNGIKNRGKDESNENEGDGSGKGVYQLRGWN